MIVYYRLIAMLSDCRAAVIDSRTMEHEDHRMEAVFDMPAIIDELETTGWMWDIDHKVLISTKEVTSLMMEYKVVGEEAVE